MRSSRLTGLLLAAAIAPALALPASYTPDPTHTYVYFEVGLSLDISQLPPRIVDSVLLPGRQPEAGGLFDGAVQQDRRCGESGDLPMIYRGACHCGAVKFRVRLSKGLRTARRCNCSFCRMRGAVAVSAPLDGVVQGLVPHPVARAFPEARGHDGSGFRWPHTEFGFADTARNTYAFDRLLAMCGRTQRCLLYHAPVNAAARW